jgi:hypothetical protein
MITEQEYLKGREVDNPLTEEQKNNMNYLLSVINKIRKEWGKAMIINSGYRPAEINANVPHAAKSSAHITCQAIDIKDDGSLYNWIIENNILVKYDLYMENRRATRSWVHLQTRATKSGNRIFMP